jgi:vesicle coat complex subunit
VVPAPANYHETIANAIPPLIGLLNHTDHAVRGHARQVLAYFDSEFAPLIPFFMKCLTDPSTEVRVFAVTALCKDAVQPPEAVPAVARCLRDSEPRVRLAAACGLKRYGRRAKVAVPALLTALDDPSLRDAVAEALKTIDPEAAVRKRVE